MVPPIVTDHFQKKQKKKMFGWGLGSLWHGCEVRHLCSPSPPSGPSGAPSLLFRRMGRLPLQSARRVYKGPWHAWVGLCVVGTEVTWVCRCQPLWGNALLACHIDMLKAVAFLFACGLNVGMVVSWARQVCGWCFLGRGGGWEHRVLGTDVGLCVG
jgi:hypothetical protein